MTVDQHSALAVLRPLDLEVSAETLDVTLDEAWSPYVRATLTCAMPASDAREAIDLRTEDIRLDLRLRQDFGQPWSLSSLPGSMAALTTLLGGQPLSSLTNRFYRPWNGSSVRAARKRNMRLLVTDRIFDDAQKQLTIVAASLEALLLGDALISATPLNPGTTSLKAIVQSVLDRYGEQLDADSEDAVVAEAAATIWQPGVGAWDYLDPMLEAASLRLWCDETGTFRISPRQQTTPGAVTIVPTGTMTGLRDTMTRDPAVWYDAVVVEYRWVDDFDLNQVAYDVAGPQPATSTLRVVKEQTRYPGPGAAAGILNRGQGRGRVLDVEAVSDYLVTPGMAASITPVDTPSQTGYVSTVTWRLPDAEMEVATRGLVDTPDTSWLFTEAGVSWDDIDAGVSWLEYEGA